MINKTVKDKSKAKFISFLLENAFGNISDACKLIGFSRQTVNEWRHSDPDFNLATEEAILAGKETLADLAETGLQKRIREGDTTAIIFTLKSLRRPFFGERLEVAARKENDGDNNQAMKPGFVNTLLRLGLRSANLTLLNPAQKEQLNNIIEILGVKSAIINEDDKS